MYKEVIRREELMEVIGNVEKEKKILLEIQNKNTEDNARINRCFFDYIVLLIYR